MGHTCGGLRPGSDYHFDEAPYDPWLAYGQSKTANIYLASEIERRYGTRGLHATSLHPGVVLTGLVDTVSPEDAEKWSDPKMLACLKSPEQGAATSVYAAVGAEWRNKGGRFLSDCVEQGPTKHPGQPMYFGDDGYAAWAFDEEAARRLWEDSMAMVGLEGHE